MTFKPGTRLRRSKMNPVARTDDTTQEIIDWVGKLTGAVWQHTQQRMAELGISMPEAKALLNLDAEHATSMRELAAAIHVSPSNVTVTVDRLEARGLVDRVESEDRRVRGVRLAEAGAKLQRDLEERIAIDHPAVRGLDEPARATLLDVLRKLNL